MDVSAERGPRGVVMSSAERWTSRYQPPSGCGSSRKRAISSLAGSMRDGSSATRGFRRVDSLPAAGILRAEPGADRERRDALAQRGRVDLSHRVVGGVVHVEVDGRVESGFEDRHAELREPVEIRAALRLVVAARELEGCQRLVDL